MSDLNNQIKFCTNLINILLELMIKYDSKKIEKLYDKVYEKREFLYKLLGDNSD